MGLQGRSEGSEKVNTQFCPLCVGRCRCPQAGSMQGGQCSVLRSLQKALSVPKNGPIPIPGCEQHLNCTLQSRLGTAGQG